MLDELLIENNSFRPFSLAHFCVLLVGFSFFTLLILYARRCSPRRQVFIGALLSYTILFTFLGVYVSIDSWRLGFEPKKHLPLAMCNVCAMLSWLVLHRKIYWMYEILFFWIMSGTVAACLTPDIKEAFPHYTFLVFWIIHIGLVGSAFYATLVYGMRPTFGSLMKSFLAILVYAPVVGLINWLLRDYDTNFFYVCRKPDTWTPLDLFGDWPWYLFFGVFFAMFVFLVIYSPFYLSDRLSRRTSLPNPPGD